MLDDLRAAVRGLRRRRLASLISVAILAAGLTAGTAVFTYLNGFRQPFPGVTPSGLVHVHGIERERPFTRLSYPDYLDLQDGAARVFSGVAAVESGYAASIRHETSTDVVFLEAVSGNFFEVLDVEMAAGRPLAPTDDVPGAEPVAVISHGWWLRQWNGSPEVIGSVVNFNYRPHVVVGVAGPDFRGSLASFRPEAWLPFEPFRDRYTNSARAAEDRDTPLVRVYARLAEGVREGDGQALLSRVAAGLDEVYPRGSDQERRFGLRPASWIDPTARSAEAGLLRMMSIAALGLLLLVCANVGNLLLALTRGRDREIALRAALGASRGRIVRQLVLENLVLCSIAGTIATLAAGPVSRRLGSYFARPSVWGANIAREGFFDLRVLLFASGIALAMALLTTVAPALGVTGRDLRGVLAAPVPRRRGPSRLGGWIPDLRETLVGAQVALAVILVLIAGVVLRSLERATSIDPGFDADGLVASYISTSSTSVQEHERDQYFRDLARDLSDEPWVRAATISDAAPLSPHGMVRVVFDGRDDEVALVASRVVPGFFDALGLNLLEGRTFTRSDSAGAPPVAVLNRAALDRYGSGARGAGRSIHLASDPERSYEVVGVVEDARVRDLLADPEPVVYLSNPQQGYASGSALVVRVEGEPASAVPRIRRWLLDYEAHLAIVNILPYSDVIRGFTYTQRMNAELFSVLAALALALAALGIYGVMALSVSSRRREIGVRIAIGAGAGDIGRLVAGRVALSVGGGLVAGLMAAWSLRELSRALLYDMEPGDPVTGVAGAAVLLLTALLAAAVPARRALSVDPVHSLQADP